MPPTRLEGRPYCCNWSSLPPIVDLGKPDEVSFIRLIQVFIGLDFIGAGNKRRGNFGKYRKPITNLFLKSTYLERILSRAFFSAGQMAGVRIVRTYFLVLRQYLIEQAGTWHLWL
jgi:hypothetical protein